MSRTLLCFCALIAIYFRYKHTGQVTTNRVRNYIRSRPIKYSPNIWNDRHWSPRCPCPYFVLCWFFVRWFVLKKLLTNFKLILIWSRIYIRPIWSKIKFLQQSLSWTVNRKGNWKSVNSFECVNSIKWGRPCSSPRAIHSICYSNWARTIRYVCLLNT